MLKLACDENLNNNILRGLFRKRSDLDIVRIQDAGLIGADDPTVLEWAARENRVLLTHDVATITRYAYERLDEGHAMPGVFEIDPFAPMGQVIEDVLLLAEFSFEGEWEGQIAYIPLK
jgi:hypothetical protein